jgi:hypothetical protein
MDAQSFTTVDVGTSSTEDVSTYALASDTDNVDDGVGSSDSDD